VLLFLLWIESSGVVGYGSIGERVLSDTKHCMDAAARRLHYYNSIEVIFVYEQVIDHSTSVLAVQTCRDITLSVCVCYELADVAVKAPLC
jgi:hypothetical protein